MNFRKNLYLGLWDMFQLHAGGTLGKRQLALKYYTHQKRVCEVGCATGNISQAFLSFPDIEFLGVDIDQAAVDYATARFLDYPKFRFMATDFRSLCPEKYQFDYIIFAGILHHIDDQLSIQFLDKAIECLAPAGKLSFSEPIPPNSNDPILHRIYGILERGKWMRSEKQLRELVNRVPRMKLERISIQAIAPQKVDGPSCARFAIASASRRLIGNS